MPSRAFQVASGNLTSNLVVSGSVTANSANISGTVSMGSSFIRNRLINGDMRIAQRGTTGNFGYLLDRWEGFNTTTMSQSSDAPPGFLYSLEYGSTSTTYVIARQKIERLNSYDLAGKTVTLSFWAKNLNGSAALYCELYRANTNDNFAASTPESGFSFGNNPSSSWTYYTARFNLSSSANTGLELRIVRDNTSTANTRVTGVQLEVGSTATPFEYRSYGQELALCQRYYQQYDYSSVYNGSNGRAVPATKFSASDSIIGNIPLFTPLRITNPVISSTSSTARFVSAAAVATVNVAALMANTGILTMSYNNNSIAASYGWLDNFGVISINAEL